MRPLTEHDTLGPTNCLTGPLTTKSKREHMTAKSKHRSVTTMSKKYTPLIERSMTSQSSKSKSRSVTLTTRMSTTTDKSLHESSSSLCNDDCIGVNGCSSIGSSASKNNSLNEACKVVLDHSYTAAIVYKSPSILKCSHSTEQLPTNTSAGLPKSSQSKQETTILAKAKPKPKSSSVNQKTNIQSKLLEASNLAINSKNKAKQTKKAYEKWTGEYYDPTHFLTVQLPDNQKTKDVHLSRERLKHIMIAFQYRLLGRHWNKKHLPFICYSENGDAKEWHYHILFNAGEFTTQELSNAILKTTINLQLPFYSLDLKRINDDIVHSYCTKELKVYINGNLDTDPIILSHDLFGLPYKTPQKKIIEKHS